MKRAYMLVQVNLDPIPGDMHTEESAVENLEAILNHNLGHYKPYVRRITESDVEIIADRVHERAGIHRD